MSRMVLENEQRQAGDEIGIRLAGSGVWVIADVPLDEDVILIGEVISIHVNKVTSLSHPYGPVWCKKHRIVPSVRVRPLLPGEKLVCVE